MKERNNLIRWIIFAILLSLAIYSLIPTYQTYFSSERDIIEKIKLKSDLIKALDKMDTGEELTVLERNLIDELGDDPEYLSLDPEEISKLDRFEKNNLKSLKLGLDLQGGMHLVLEIDYEQLLKNKAKRKDSTLEDLLIKAKRRSENDKDIYFEEIRKAFSEEDISMNEYFGLENESDQKIIESLKEDAQTGISTTLEILRNRIDQFGIAEPSIQKRGKHRIIVELPGVKDEERAANLVNQAAFLEFKLVAEDDVVKQKLDEIDLIVSKEDDPLSETSELFDKDISDNADNEEAEEDTGSDAQDPSELFEDQDESTVEAEDDDKTPKEDSFRSLLESGRGGEIYVREANRIKVIEILRKSKVRKILGNYEFVWKNKPDIFNNETYYELVLVESKAALDGTSIVNANASMAGGSSSTGGWEVPFELNKEGGRIFSEVTGKNVGRRLAIILDNKLYMAPNIQNRIPNGRGVITLGRSTPEEAQDLAIVLKAGALEAPLEIMEKRTIGPSLGADSIEKGVTSAVIGFLLVVVFIIAFYKLSGLFAVIAIMLNFIFTLASLSAFGGTLTLPGIAGIILTIGMAVDANIIIFERIKEEIVERNTILTAINSGYERAFTTIFDSNITTFIAGITLYQFGTGPVRGFALTLMIGILWSMYTAVIVTRLFSDLYINSKSKKMSI
ncbi:MAG: protein translocase subunit SecD [Candidatus Delongbacteria bacterium]